MNAPRIFVLAVAAVAAALVALTAVLLTRSPHDGVRLTGAPVATLLSLEPTDPQFGDTVVATVEIFVDTRRVDPSSVVLHTDFTPFAAVSSLRSVDHVGGIATIHVVDRLDCLDAICAPQNDVATFRLPRIQVTYPGNTLTPRWPVLRVHDRALPTDVTHPLLHVGDPRVQTSYRLPPTATGWTMVGVAIAAALGSLALLLQAVLPSSRLTRRPRGSELDRILDRLAHANGDGGLRRATLEQLARALEPLDEPLSFESRVLAWAPQDPEPDTISDLTRRIRATVKR